MRYLLVGAHPGPDSFSAALRHAAADALTAAGHEVDVLDLYAEAFDPVVSRTERAGYFEAPANRKAVEHHLARLEAADGLVLVYPTWWFGFPAILKGWFDRVWLPGAVFAVGNRGLEPRLLNIRRFVVITTYGSPWWSIRLVMGDPMGKIVRRGLRTLCHPSCRVLFLAQYGLDRATPAARQTFLHRVKMRLAQIR